MKHSGKALSKRLPLGVGAARFLSRDVSAQVTMRRPNSQLSHLHQDFFGKGFSWGNAIKERFF